MSLSLNQRIKCSTEWYNPGEDHTRGEHSRSISGRESLGERLRLKQPRVLLTSVLVGVSEQPHILANKYFCSEMTRKA